jgi:methylmalonyl-CoA mutase N-terminal domain/subunit
VAISSLADMEVLLDGLPLDRVSTSMTINSPAAPIGRCTSRPPRRGFRAILEARPERHPQGFVAQKGFLFPPEPSLRLVTDTIEFGTRELPRWNTISISSCRHREAGSTAVQELAFTIADSMAYVERRWRAGCGSTTSPRSRSSSTRAATSSRRSPSSGQPAASGSS